MSEWKPSHEVERSFETKLCQATVLRMSWFPGHCNVLCFLAKDYTFNFLFYFLFLIKCLLWAFCSVLLPVYSSHLDSHWLPHLHPINHYTRWSIPFTLPGFFCSLSLFDDAFSRSDFGLFHKVYYIASLTIFWEPVFGPSTTHTVTGEGNNNISAAFQVLSFHERKKFWTTKKRLIFGCPVTQVTKKPMLC